jgi:apolipoprotein N-acyltransferase
MQQALWYFAWLAVGGIFALFSQGTGAIPLAAWLAPAFLLHFAHLAPRWRDLLSIWFIVSVAGAIVNRGVIPLSGVPYFSAVAANACFYFLPCLADRLLSPRLPGLASTLVFPLTWVTLEFLSGFLPAKGSWGDVAYTQYGNLPLMQLASVTGIFGITFLIGWFAAVLNRAWDQGFAGEVMRGPVLLYAVIFSLAMLAGACRLALAPSNVKSVRVAAVNSPGGMFRPGEITRILRGNVRDEERQPFRTNLQRLADWLLENARTEARAGAKFVAWPETGLIVFQEDEAAFLDRARQMAAQEQIYLLMGVAVIHFGARHPFENKVVLADPSGNIEFSYRKSRPAPNWEMAVMEPGDGRLPTAATQYGRVAAAICFEMDFPQFIRQVTRSGASILFAPSNDWEKIKDLHFRMAAFRAIENGVSLVRPTHSGLSGAVDPFGRPLAIVDTFSPVVRTMVAQVPVSGVRTLYARFGDLFAWLCFAALLVLSIFALSSQHFKNQAL